MVCLGNICRSPIADGLLRYKVEQNNLPIIVDSAGTSAHHIDEAPDPRMRKVAQEKGTPIDFLRARQFESSDFENFDIIYAMDESNLRNILNMARNETEKGKVRLFLNELYPGKNLHVPDPYFGGEKGFYEVYDMVDETTDVIIQKYKSNTL
jgi:protein-tyrosine phosphatase